MIRSMLYTFLLLALFSSSSFAQATRTPPPANSQELFVEVAEPAAGDYQVLVLPRAKENGFAVDDVLIVDRPSGKSLIVRAAAHPFGYGYVNSPFVGTYAAFFECFQFVALRPGVTWTVGNLDNDGIADLIGHDRARGEIVRVYQRGNGACTY